LFRTGLRGRRFASQDFDALAANIKSQSIREIFATNGPVFGYDLRMSNESDSKTYEERAWQYFLQLQPSIADVNAAADLAFRAVDAFDRGLKRRRTQGD
jgi:hypothetical protein